MTSGRPARIPGRRARPTAAVLLALLALLVVTPLLVVAGGREPLVGALARPSAVTAAPVSASGPPRSSAADGATVVDGAVPAVTGLDPALLGALRRAATDARFPFTVTSGRRSPERQEELLREAVARYGSEAEAARWVATPETSAHVSGDAVDVGSAATAWLSRHGAAYGLCQIYDNEPWHFELRPAAVDRGCPPRYADPTHDPRMQR